MSDPSVIGSPKRKRTLDDEICRAESPLRLRTDVDQTNEETHYASGSPRAHMSNQFLALRIQTGQQVKDLSFRGKSDTPIGSAKAQSSSSLETSYNTAADFQHARPTYQGSTDSSIQNHAPTGPNVYKHAGEQPQAVSPLGYPFSPPSAATPMNPASSTSTMNTHQDKEASSLPTDDRLSSIPPRVLSPPPSTTTSDLVWSESEITGHDPNDPNDDGYGINGIGFRPTPAMAAARAIKRRQQLSDWKARELRDARNRRAERRREAGIESTLSSGSLGEGASSERKVVRFVEG